MFVEKNILIHKDQFTPYYTGEVPEDVIVGMHEKDAPAGTQFYDWYNNGLKWIRNKFDLWDQDIYVVFPYGSHVTYKKPIVYSGGIMPVETKAPEMPAVILPDNTEAVNQPAFDKSLYTPEGFIYDQGLDEYKPIEPPPVNEPVIFETPAGEPEIFPLEVRPIEPEPEIFPVEYFVEDIPLPDMPAIDAPQYEMEIDPGLPLGVYDEPLPDIPANFNEPTNEIDMLPNYETPTDIYDDLFVDDIFPGEINNPGMPVTNDPAVKTAPAKNDLAGFIKSIPPIGWFGIVALTFIALRK